MGISGKVNVTAGHLLVSESLSTIPEQKVMWEFRESCLTAFLLFIVKRHIQYKELIRGYYKFVQPDSSDNNHYKPDVVYLIS